MYSRTLDLARKDISYLSAVSFLRQIRSGRDRNRLQGISSSRVTWTLDPGFRFEVRGSGVVECAMQRSAMQRSAIQYVVVQCDAMCHANGALFSLCALNDVGIAVMLLLLGDLATR